MRALAKILRSRGGATAIEYALIASLISVAAIVGTQNIGSKLATTFNNVSNEL
jgi:pilus assembly protein Flp/PilA